MGDWAIQVEGLTKDYNGFRAVNQISFSVGHGSVFGFLGPNGAGKTTTIKMLCTLLRPSGGEARVAGHSVFRHPMEVRRSIGIIFQEPTLDERLTAYENLKFHGILYGMRGSSLEKRITEVLQLVQLSEKQTQMVKTFSGGMKRRLELARGLMHTPGILFLDEPTLGLDPQTRVHIWDYLKSLRKHGNLTLFLTTHYMDEAENCDEIAIIDRGQIVALDSPARLKAQVSGSVVALKTGDDARAVDFLRLRYQLEPKLDSEGVHVEVLEPEKWLPGFLRESPVPVESLNVHRPTLEDVFIHLTGKEIREEEGSWLDSARAVMRQRRSAK